MKKILITGANGYIGKHVSQAAKTFATGYGIIDTDIRTPDNHSSGTKFVECDILKEASDEKLYEKLGKPDIVVHLAWQDGFNHKSLSHISNLYNHYLFIKNMMESGCSSISVMGTMHEIGYHEGAIDENTPCNPLSLYGVAKNALREMSYILSNENKKFFMFSIDSKEVSPMHSFNFVTP